MAIQKCEKSKNGLLAKIAWHYLCQEGRIKTRIFVHTICFGQKCFLDQNNANQEKNYKNSGFSGICPKPKMTPFLWKRCFLTWVKKWVLLTAVGLFMVLVLVSFFFVFCSCFFGLFLFFCFFGGFKGQVRWPKGPPHLALNPPYFFVFLFLFLLFVFFFARV